MDKKYELIISKLTEQIAELSKDRAMFYALYASEKELTKSLTEELESLKATTETE